MQKIFRSKSKKEQSLAQLLQLEEQMSSATSFINEIKKGNFNLEVPQKLTGSDLGGALVSMKEYLTKISIAEEQRNWLNVGLAKFSDILRNKKSLPFKQLCDDILLNLVKYVGANQGAIFTTETNASDPQLRMVACYAYDRKKYLEKTFELGEGLAGQCYLEKQPIFLKVVPLGYTSITSGLGEATPRTIFISPLTINDEVYGIVELASIAELQDHHIDFINKLSENIAATIKSSKESERTNSLLTASQQQTEELRSQEEEMRQIIEEMQATQEEMKRKSDELNQASEMLGVMRGIDATMARIEFLSDATIVQANEIFLKTLECSLEEITGEHHRMFVPKDILASEEYQSFWKQLAAGHAFTGIFRRVASSGKTVWLNAIYNPIKGADGKVFKVVKFATDITDQQELLAQTKGVLTGINATMATVEFTPDGTIVKANGNFLTAMECSAEHIVGKHHRIFVPADIVATKEYHSFWQQLSEGNPFTGTFRRVTSSGKTVWLNAIYNPIKGADGKVIKVVKFATDITDQQELLAQTKGVLTGINATMATVEFTPEGTIVNANENFLKVMKYSLEEIKDKHHRLFVPKQIANSFEYKTFWQRLSEGEATTGTFERVNKNGEKIMLKAIYNPIADSTGVIVKVIKFATEISFETISR